MITGPPPKFHGTRDILRRRMHHHTLRRSIVIQCSGGTQLPRSSFQYPIQRGERRCEPLIDTAVMGE